MQTLIINLIIIGVLHQLSKIKKNTTIDELTCIICEIGGCAQIQGVTSFVGNGVSAVSARCQYWADSNIYPLTSICFRFKFSTLAAGLGIDIQVLEEAAI